MAFNDWLGQNSGALLQASAGLLGGRTGSEQAGMGLAGFGNAMAETKQKNKTLDFLRQMNPQLAQAVEAGTISPLDAYKTHLESQKPQKPNFVNAGGSLYNPDTGEWLSPPAGAGNDAEFGLNPQYGVDAQGNPVILQLSKGGTSRQTALPDGVSLAKEPIKLDAGTHFVLLDPVTRQPVGQIPKDLAGAERAKSEGKALGEADSAYSSLTSKMPGLESVVKKLDSLSADATYTSTGQLIDTGRKQLGLDPRAAAVARSEYIAIVDNQVLPLLRDTFGAAFTQKEGETLRATLGDPDKSPSEKQAVLKAFIEQKRRDVEALGSQTGVQPAPTKGVVDYTDYFKQ
jgi:hypothetical protein